MIEDIATRFDIEGTVIPALVARPEKGSPRGVILLLHGLGADKSHQRPEIRRLARAGFTAVVIDAPAHGDRYEADIHDRIAAEGRPGERTAFRELLSRAVGEFPGLFAYLRREEHPRLGLAGISMGGHTAFQAMLLPDKPDACVPLIASPDLVLPGWPRPEAPEAPRRQPQAFAPTPIMMVTAGRDDIVPPGPTMDFADELRPFYAAFPERLVNLQYPESGHFMRKKDWKDAWERISDFFVQNLSENN